MTAKPSIFKRFPSLCLLGFFPPIYILGVLVFTSMAAGMNVILDAPRQITGAELTPDNDLWSDTLRIALLWPLDIYRELKY